MSRRLALQLTRCLLGLGAALRLWQYVYDRALWMDEAMLALNIAVRGPVELLLPLDFNQAAPLLFLQVERLLATTLGVHEQALRAFPMLCGLLTLVLGVAVARRLAGEAGALTAAALFALSPILIRFSNEVKPYAGDGLASLAFAWLTLRVIEAPEQAGRWRTLLWGGACAVLASFPALFAAAGAVAALVTSPGVREHRARIGTLAVLWPALGLGAYWFVYQHVAQSGAQQQGYAAALLAPGPELWERLGMFARGALLPLLIGNGASVPSVSAGWTWLFGAFVLYGALQARRMLGSVGVILLLGPLAVAIVASALRRYPLGVPRLMMFWAPLGLLCVACAGAALVERARGVWPRRSLIAGALVGLVALGVQAGHAAATPFVGEDTPRLLALWQQHRRGEHEPIYIGAKAIPAWLFYTTAWEGSASVLGEQRRRLAYYTWAASAGPSFENAPSRGRRVVREGDGLVHRFRRGQGREELLGLSAGRPWSWPNYAGGGPDPGWAANEARRIRDAALRAPQNERACAWMLFTRLSERVNKPITWELRDNFGATLDLRQFVPGGVLYRYCFPQGPPATPR